MENLKLICVCVCVCVCARLLFWNVNLSFLECMKWMLGLSCLKSLNALLLSQLVFEKVADKEKEMDFIFGFRK